MDTPRFRAPRVAREDIEAWKGNIVTDVAYRMLDSRSFDSARRFDRSEIRWLIEDSAETFKVLCRWGSFENQTAAHIDAAKREITIGEVLERETTIRGLIRRSIPSPENPWATLEEAGR
ncbi:MAG: hypothetical protein KGH72_01595 [Candidatus Micrarchaeota archaeon]|nr:hypothetical protein [Candidatus Micrarchaeota archaeon]